MMVNFRTDVSLGLHIVPLEMFSAMVMNQIEKVAIEPWFENLVFSSLAADQ